MPLYGGYLPLTGGTLTGTLGLNDGSNVGTLQFGGTAISTGVRIMSSGVNLTFARGDGTSSANLFAGSFSANLIGGGITGSYAYLSFPTVDGLVKFVPNANTSGFGLLATTADTMVVRNFANSAAGNITALAGTFTGLLQTVLSATGGAGFNLPHGAAPTSPVNGDLWTTTAGMFVRINGVTKSVNLT